MSLSRAARFALLTALLALAGPAAAAQAATLHVSTTGSDSAGCSLLAPCKSFSRAYQAAAAGDVVEVAGGTYGGQSLSNLPAKASSAKVVFRPAVGAQVSLGSLSVSRTSNVEIRDMRTTGWNATNGAAHVVFRNLTVLNQTDGGFMSGVDDVQVIGGEIGYIDPGDGIHFNNQYGRSTNILIDGLYMHDLTRTTDPSAHDDGIQTGDVDGLVIRNSVFTNSGTQGIFLEPYNGGVTRNVVVENNFLGTAQLGYNILNVREVSNVLVRNNSFAGSDFYIGPEAVNVDVYNNILASADSSDCSTLAGNADQMSNNLSPASCSGATSHTTVANLASQYVNSGSSPSSAMNLHLKAGAAAIGRSLVTQTPATDFDAQGRDGAPDAGADEAGGTTPTPTPTPTPSPTPSPTPTPTPSPTPTPTPSPTPSPTPTPTPSPTPTTPPPAPPSGLVGAWGFDEASGSAVVDSSGRGNHGIVRGADRVAGKHGGALSFDGLDDLVTIADSPSLDLTSALTIEAWVKPAALGTRWRTIAIKEQRNQLAYGLYASNDRGRPTADIYTRGERTSSGPSALPTGAWTHVATTWDGATLRLYVNGTQVSATAVGGAVVTSSGALRIGGNTVWREWFKGAIDDVRIYNRALTATQVGSDGTAGVVAQATTSSLRLKSARRASRARARAGRHGHPRRAQARKARRHRGRANR